MLASSEEQLQQRLARVARDKLATVREEERLKAERKKKAAMFAALLTRNPNTDTGELAIQLPT